MKLTFITLFLSTTGMFASVNSQNTRVNIHVNNANTQIVLNEIEKTNRLSLCVRHQRNRSKS